MASCGVNEVIRKHNVTSVYHFTNASNLESICRYGLMPKTILMDKKIRFCGSDDMRFDGCEDAISLSVSYPNGKMLYAKQCRLGGVWVIIELYPEVLTGNCSFCPMNAAKTCMRQRNRGFKGAECFERLFADSFSCYPADEQAEVLYFGSIPVSKIRRLIFKSEIEWYDYAFFMPGSIPISIDDSFFNTRNRENIIFYDILPF